MRLLTNIPLQIVVNMDRIQVSGGTRGDDARAFERAVVATNVVAANDGPGAGNPKAPGVLRRDYLLDETITSLGALFLTE